MTSELKIFHEGDCFVTVVGKKIMVFLLVMYIYLLAPFEQNRLYFNTKLSHFYMPKS